MAISRAERRAERTDRARLEFGSHSEAVLDLLDLLDLLELTELAWHDCYGDVTPSESVVDDIFVVAKGSLAELIHAARLAVTDFRDLRISADQVRS